MNEDYKNCFQVQLKEANTPKLYASLIQLQKGDKITYLVEVLFKFTHVYLKHETINATAAKELFYSVIK